jgi:hypothetical protein
VPWKTWPAATEEDPPAAAHACSVRGALVIAETAARIPLYVMASATRIPVQMVGDVAGRLGLHVPSCRRVRQT